MMFAEPEQSLRLLLEASTTGACVGSCMRVFVRAEFCVCVCVCVCARALGWLRRCNMSLDALLLRLTLWQTPSHTTYPALPSTFTRQPWPPPTDPRC
jgi:hypothetical protein